MTDGVQHVPTPFALVNGAVLDNNLQQMQDLADKYTCRLRPHIKTHKSIKIARRQLEKGAVGITTAKLSEAAVFLKAGFKDITVAYPVVVVDQIREILDLAQVHKSIVRLAVDSHFGIEQIALAAREASQLVELYIIVDTGFHRCGVVPDGRTLLELTREITKTPYLNLYGLLTHGGQAYSAGSKKEAAEACEEEINGLMEAGIRIRKAGLGKPLLSIGSTPGLLAGVDLSPIDEIRPGNYAFMDRTPLRLGLIGPEDIALSIISTVVSMNDKYWICDAGSKYLSSDGGAHGMSSSDGYGLVCTYQSEIPQVDAPVITKLSEEHGWISRKDSVEIAIGDRIRIFPNHSCVIPNLAGEFYLAEGAEDRITRFAVEARGCSQ